MLEHGFEILAGFGPYSIKSQLPIAYLGENPPCCELYPIRRSLV